MKTIQHTFRADEEQESLLNALSHELDRSLADTVRYSLYFTAIAKGLFRKKENMFLEDLENIEFEGVEYELAI